MVISLLQKNFTDNNIFKKKISKKKFHEKKINRVSYEMLECVTF